MREYAGSAPKWILRRGGAPERIIGRGLLKAHLVRATLAAFHPTLTDIIDLTPALSWSTRAHRRDRHTGATVGIAESE